MNYTHLYRNVKIVVTKGDITQQRVDAIVNPANSQLTMGGGAAGAIRRVGGKEIENEALQHAPVPVGKAVATSAGRLTAKYVIHAPTMEEPAMHIGLENVHLATKAALERAECLKIKSIAFPGLGTGVGGVDLKKGAQVMVEALKEHVDRDMSLKEVIFVGFSEESTANFKDAVQKILI